MFFSMDTKSLYILVFQAVGRGNAKYTFNPESSSVDVDMLTQITDNTPRHQRIRQTTAAPTSALDNANQSTRNLRSKSLPASRRSEITTPASPVDRVTELHKLQRPPTRIGRPSTTSTAAVASTVENSVVPRSGQRREIRRKKIRVLSATGRSTTAASPDSTATVAHFKSSRDTFMKRSSSEEIPTTVRAIIHMDELMKIGVRDDSKPSTTSARPTIVRKQPLGVATVTPIPPRSTTTSTATSSSAFTVAPSTTTAIPNSRRRLTVRPNVEEIVTEVTQLSSQALRPHTRLQSPSPTLGTTPPAPKPIGRAASGRLPSKSLKPKTTKLPQLADFQDENYPEHYKVALKAKLVTGTETPKQVSTRSEQRLTTTRIPFKTRTISEPGSTGTTVTLYGSAGPSTTPSAPTSVVRPQFQTRFTFPKLMKTTAAATGVPSEPPTIGSVDTNHIGPFTYVDYQNSSPRYSSRIRQHDNRAQEPTHKVRARSQNLTGLRAGPNSLLETNTLPSTATSRIKEYVSSVSFGNY